MFKKAGVWLYYVEIQTKDIQFSNILYQISNKTVQMSEILQVSKALIILNPSVADIGIFLLNWVNTVAADGLISCVESASSVMVFSM